MSDSSPAAVSSSSSDAAWKTAPIVFVDLWHPHCGACWAAQERLDQLEGQVGDGVVFERINVAEAPEIAENFDVDAVPTLLVFRDGRLRTRLNGAEKIQTFADEVEKEIGIE